MDQPSNPSQRNMASLSETVSIAIAGLQLYHDCYWLFDHWHLTCRFTDELLQRILRTGFLADVEGRIIVLFFLALALISAPRRISFDLSRKAALIRCYAGAFLFGFSPLVFIRGDDPLPTCLIYMLVYIAGYLLLAMGGARLLRMIRLPWSTEDPFGQTQAGFPQERRRIGGADALHLRSEHVWKQEKRDGWINLINPRRGILILGSPGSGKSWFLIEPLLRQLIEKGNAVFVYDFKFDTLTRIVYRYFQAYRRHYPITARFYCIQFNDLSRSHRCNLLHPSTLDWVSDALGAARTILLSMNKNWINKQGEFFVESPVNFLGALIWYLRRYQDGRYCTLPHSIELAQVPYDKLFPVLAAEPEIKALIAPFIEAWHNKTFEMLDGQVASARIPLTRLASPDLYYILTGNDFKLDINDPAAPKVFCLGGDPARQEALAPVLSLYIDRLNKLCNRPGRYPCAIVCDEFATVRANSLMTTIATGRSNKITPLLAVQDLSQLRTLYTRDEADLLLNISGNLLCGQVGGETARWVSERFPRIQREKPGISVNSKDTTITRELQWEPTVSQATIAGLSSGEFIGTLSDDPDNPLDLKAFHARILRREPADNQPQCELPLINDVTEKDILKIFEEVRSDIRQLIAEGYNNSIVNSPLF